MSIKIKLSLIGLVVVSLVVNQSLRSQQRAVTIVFGTGGAKSTSMDLYCANVMAQLKDFLESNNFTVASDPGYSLTGRLATDEERQWYEAPAAESFPFYVRISTPRGGSSGVECAVVYQCTGYRWKVQKTVAGATAFNDSLTQWWDNYQSAHPRR